MKGVILAAGLGTRLIPYSKEMPKEMLPIFVEEEGYLILKPAVQIIFEQMYEAGIREFCFIVSRHKRLIENHFTPDWNYVELLKSKNKDHLGRMLERFYKKIENCQINWITQPIPLGTGDAVLRAWAFLSEGEVVVSAGDNLYLGVNMFRELLKKYKKYGGYFLVGKRVEEPRKYGIIEYDNVTLEENVFKVKRIIEKPKKPPTNLANTSIYIFQPKIVDKLKNLERSPRGELEITSALQALIDDGEEVYVLDAGDTPWIDVGDAYTYLKAQIYSLLVNVKQKIIKNKVMDELLVAIKLFNKELNL